MLAASGSPARGEERHHYRPAQQPEHLDGGSGDTDGDGEAQQAVVGQASDHDRDRGKQAGASSQQEEPAPDHQLVVVEDGEHFRGLLVEHRRVVEGRAEAEEGEVDSDGSGDQQDSGQNATIGSCGLGDGTHGFLLCTAYRFCTVYINPVTTPTTSLEGAQNYPFARRQRYQAGLDLDRVVDAGLELLDEDGTAALSIRAVAGRLGVNPNALYNYVDSRAALEGALVERVMAEAHLDLLAVGRPWDERVLDYSLSFRKALLHHPGAAALMTTAPMNGPTALSLGESLIGTIAESGLSIDDAARAAYALIVQAVGAIVLEVAETDGRAPLPSEKDRTASRRQALSQLPAEDWPMTVATADVAAAWNTTDQYRWAIGTVLAGISSRAAWVG